MKKIVAYSIFVLAMLSCNSKSESVNDTEERIKNESLQAKDAISSHNKKIEGIYRAKQIDSLLHYMADNVIQFPPNSKPLVGKDSIRNFWQQMFQFGNVDFSLETQDVRANGPMAIELGKYVLEFSPADKSPIPAFADTGNYLVYWHKINDNWKVVWDAPVSTVPMPPR